MYWLKVKNIADGLFPTEVAVEFATTDGDVQMFVSRKQIDERHGTLKVRVLEQNDQHALVQVPGGGSVAKIAKAGVLSPE